MPNHFDENISCYKREVTVSSGARLHNGYIIIKHFNDVSSVNINNRWTPQLDWGLYKYHVISKTTWMVIEIIMLDHGKRGMGLPKILH